MARFRLSEPAVSRWELAAEAIALKIHWLGLALGYGFANAPGRQPGDLVALNAILTLGLVYASLDTFYYLRGRIFILARSPLLLSMLEALFITLLCKFDTELLSPFRYYYLLSLLVCALRYPVLAPYASCLLHCLAYFMLYLSLPVEKQDQFQLLLLLMILAWVTWAATALGLLLKRAGDHLQQLNAELSRQQTLLEERIAERTRELSESQAQVIHQEKQAAFGLLAAGIAHEVGNPLTAISGLVQMLQRRTQDAYTEEKLALVRGEMDRIQAILRELTNFSRPATREQAWVEISQIVQTALRIVKYYKRTRGKTMATEIPVDLPRIQGIPDQLTQALLNLVINAIDATEKGGTILIRAALHHEGLVLEVQDDGPPITPEQERQLFQPYFTTKPEGTGLGLFITRKLIADHGGWVSFEQEPDRKKIFRIHLPVKVMESHVVASEPPADLVTAS
jgi:signal transduction histidine kinase